MGVRPVGWVVETWPARPVLFIGHGEAGGAADATSGIERDGACRFAAKGRFTKAPKEQGTQSSLDPADQLPFPLSLRADMAAWNKLYLTSGAFQPVAVESSAWNRGAYLVEGPMHCSALPHAKEYRRCR